MAVRGRFTSQPFSIPYHDHYKPINGYGIIGDSNTVALVGFDGSIDWCCMPRFDSPSVFAAILDHRKGGKWQIRPLGKSKASQEYEPNTNILSTKYFVDHSVATVTDFMPYQSNSTGLPNRAPEIHRIVKCTKGHLKLRFSFQPRPDYGRLVPELFQSSTNGIAVKTGKNQFGLASSLTLRTSDGSSQVSRTFELERGEMATFVLRYGEAEPKNIEQYNTEMKLVGTRDAWTNWTRKLKCASEWEDMVVRSALALKLLCYSPTGAIVAAPTTSLPEVVGGERNWDYRYSWVRDTALSLWAFHLLGDKTPAEQYHKWLVENQLGLSRNLRLMHQVDGQSHVSEQVLSHLEGYRGSGPVRIGNAASRQFQLDAYGYMLDGLYFSSKHGSNISEATYQRFVKLLANYICENWEKPGHGIWEVRPQREHYVYTKAWCIAGLQRAIKIARNLGHHRDVIGWKHTISMIRNELMTRGWSQTKKAFKRTYASDDLDAASLMMPLMGIMSAKHPRVVQTIEAITSELSHGPLLFRYRTDDGLTGEEGAFLLCSFWLVACLARIGRISEARKIFERLVQYSNHLGLYSEEIDPVTGNFLGNFPQAFSHMGLIMAAYELNRAQSRLRKP